MKVKSTAFLRLVIGIIGLIVLSICLFGIPTVIGSFQWGGYDPILLGLYIPAIPFFIALLQSNNLLNYIDNNQAFTKLCVTAFRNIKLCAVAISLLFTIAMPYIFYVADKDDAPGVVAIGLVIIFASLVIAVFATVLQKLIQNAVDIKAENDLTV